jgi:hypothetical protein
MSSVVPSIAVIAATGIPSGGRAPASPDLRATRKFNEIMEGTAAGAPRQVADALSDPGPHAAHRPAPSIVDLGRQVWTSAVGASQALDLRYQRAHTLQGPRPLRPADVLQSMNDLSEYSVTMQLMSRVIARVVQGADTLMKTA